MRALVFVSAALCALGCGSGEERARFGVTVQGLSLGEVGALQVAVAEKTQCPALINRCLGDSEAVRVPLRNEQGREVSAIRVPFTAQGAADGGVVAQQQAEISELEVAVGRDYVLVVEALSRANAFLGSTCVVIPYAVGPGRNEPLQAVTLDLPDVAPSCAAPVLEQ